MKIYGNYLFAEDKFNGYWRIQTDDPVIRGKMRKITRDKRSPWKRCGWGTSDLFRRTFTRKATALAFFAKLGGSEYNLTKTKGNDTWELRNK